MMQQLLAPPTRVLVLHAEAIVGFGLAAALASHSGFSARVSSLAEEREPEGDFDVIVCDYDTGLRLARAARLQPAPRRAAHVLVVTTQDREHAVRLALESGVQGYMLQGCPIDELVTGVRALARGQRFLSLAVAQRMADSMAREALTGRESQVLDLLAYGHCNKSIARELQIAVGTVKAHVKAIMAKLEAGSRTQAVSVAAQRGLVALQMPDAVPAMQAFMSAQRAAPRAAVSFA
jgi:DNA-binding NarL/FixJ family response regulator